MSRIFHSFRLGTYNLAVPQNETQKIIYHYVFGSDNLLPFFIKCIWNDDMDAYPVVDTRMKMGLPDPQENRDAQSCFLIERYNFADSFFKVGLLMDRFQGIFSISSPKKILQPNKHFYNDEVFKGVCQIDNKEHFIVDQKNLFASDEMNELYHIYQDHETEASYIPVVQG